MSTPNLFAEFNKSTAEDWRKIIEKELNGGSIEDLYTNTPEGIKIQPYYHATSSKNENQTISNPLQLENPGLPLRFWVNQYKIEVKDLNEANKEAIWALNSGAEGIIFKVEVENIDFSVLLKGIQPEYCMLSFLSSSNIHQILTSYFQYLTTEKFDHEKITGTCFFDPLENRDAGKIKHDQVEIESFFNLIREYSHFNNFKVFHVSAQLYHNAGANIIHELSFTLSKLVEYLDLLTDKGLKPDQLFNSLSFGFAFGRHYFFEIAKIKVFKALLIKIAAAYNHNLSASDIIIHAFTGSRSKSGLDINVNLLRNSTEAMAAILSGCDSLYVAPHDEIRKDNPKETFKRIALNVSSILREEVYLDKIVDPTLGTYYLDQVILEMEENVWDHFMNIEEHGSYSVLFQQGLLQQSIKKDEEESAALVTDRKDLFIGANTYQLIGESILEMAIAEEEGNYLFPKRLTHQIEALRGRTEKYVKQKGEEKRPMATILLLDKDPVSKAKANFSYSFLGMAGIGIQEEHILQEIDELPDQLKRIRSELTVLCYKEKPKELSYKIDKSQTLLLIAGQEANEEHLKQAGIYACIHRKTPSLEFLNQLLNELGI